MRRERRREGGRENRICEKYLNKTPKLDTKLVNVHRTIKL